MEDELQTVPFEFVDLFGPCRLSVDCHCPVVPDSRGVPRPHPPPSMRPLATGLLLIAGCRQGVFSLGPGVG